MKVRDYIVVEVGTSDVVKEHIDKGWQPYGSMSSAYDPGRNKVRHFQPMVKEQE